MQTQGEFYADKLMDLANLASMVLIFGQLVAEGQIKWPPLSLGVAFLLSAAVVSYFFRRRGKKT